MWKIFVVEGRVLIGAGGGFCWGGEDFDRGCGGFCRGEEDFDRGWWRIVLGRGGF